MKSILNLDPKKALLILLKEKARRRAEQIEYEAEDKITSTWDRSKSLIHNPNSPYYDLLHTAKRYKVYYGGRGAAKDWSIAEALITRTSEQRTRVLCTREYQNSIADSVHKVLADTIERMGLSHRFNVTQHSIKSDNNSEFIFKGLHNNSAEIKSTEGIDICYLGEAQSTAKDSFKDLRNTIRKTGSQIWIAYNPLNRGDPIHQEFVINTHPLALIHHVNYDSNPYFPKELEDERQYMLSLIESADNDDERAQAQADYDHVWFGATTELTNDLVLAGKVLVQGFPDDLWRKAERLLFGADFGFAQDPSTLIRSFILDGCLYIEHEAWGIGVELLDMPKFYETVSGAREWPIKADNARPETISFLSSQGFRISAADKWPGSVEDGIAHLRGFKKIIIHERCKRAIQESRSYRYKVDRVTKEILAQIVDKNNHCLVAGTLVTTARGDVPIEQVAAGDKVLTRAGFKPVTFSGQTGTNREVVCVATASHSFICTPDHEVYVKGKGFIRADALRYTDELLTIKMETACQTYLSIKAKNIDAIQKANAEPIDAISNGLLNGTVKRIRNICIDVFGKIRLGLSLKGFTSITKTGILLTTLSKILNAYPLKSISRNIRSKESGEKEPCTILTIFAILQKLGMQVKRGVQSTGKSAASLTRILNRSSNPATNVNGCIYRESLEIKTVFALTSASQRIVAPVASITSKNDVLSVEQFLPQANILASNLVLEAVQCVEVIGIADKVYDLTIEDQHEFFANGVLVHNCYDAVRYSLDGYIQRRGAMGVWAKLGKIV